jgi:starch phosphorylase
MIELRESYLKTTGWCKGSYLERPFNPIAYFSMEFGLGEALPLYAGGLGILAGDYLKTASDLDVPVIGIGLRFQEGYFRQLIDVEGRQFEAFPRNDPTNLPIRPVKDNAGGWLRVFIELPGRTLFLRVWIVQVGRVMLYLLDCNDPMNHPVDRSILYKLYDDKPEFRLIQEMVLGIGGWRIIKALNIPVELCHLNEGHSAFAILERAKNFMQETGKSFDVALWATRAGNIFTTHTPVAAGFDRFPASLIARYFKEYVRELDISIDRLLSMGQEESQIGNDSFVMANLAMHGCIEVNGVSKLHREVSQHIFSPLFPRWPQREVPIGSITNGVHMPSWDSKWADDLWTDAAGKGCWCGNLENISGDILKRSDSELWTLRNNGRLELVNYVRRHLTNQFEQYSLESYDLEQVKQVFSPDVLTLGFARRFTSYKRPNLLISNPERLAAIINHAERPVQIVVAGKAHPRDEVGKQMVWQFVNFARQLAIRARVVFLADYDMSIAQQLSQGVDLWLNTPLRPWEACGTSGMKVLVNGGINISELDGWWAEAYTQEVGWALGDGKEHTEPGWDIVEANQLYELLEQQIIPEFYHRNEAGIPVDWITRIRESMSTLTPVYSSNRMLREYVKKMYWPATNRFRERNVVDAKLAAELFSWQTTVARSWYQLRFGGVKARQEGLMWYYDVPVHTGDLDPNYIKVELYADPYNGSDAVTQPLAQNGKVPEEKNWYLFSGVVSASRPAEHYTPRIVPFHPAARVPMEENRILWYSANELGA